MRRRPSWQWLLCAAAIFFFIPLGWRPLWDSDEGRYAEIAREMLQLRDWWTPHLNHVLYFEKPPLMYWLTAVSLSIFGQNAFAARFWCAVFAVLTVGLLYQIGRAWRNPRTGALAGVIAATSVGFFVFSQFLVLDMALTFWTTLTLGAASRLFSDLPAPSKKRYLYAVAIGFAGGFLTKGPVAVVLPLAAMIATALWTGRFKEWRPASWVLPAIVFTLICAPWFLWMIHRYSFFAQFFFVHEHVARFLTSVHHRDAPFYFFIPVVLVGFLPWTAFLPSILHRWFRQKALALRQDPIAALWMIWSLGVFGFFSLSHSKLVTYVLPIFPILSLLVAEAFDQIWERTPVQGWILHGAAGLCGVWIAGLLFLKHPFFIDVSRYAELAAFLEQAGPLYLALALAVFATVGVRSMRRTPKIFYGIAAAQGILLWCTCGVLCSLSPFQSTRHLAEIVNERSRAQEKLVAYGISYENVLQTLAFYTHRRIAVYADAGELSLGRDHAPDAAEWFVPDDRALEALARLPSGTWIVTDVERWQRLKQTTDAYVLIEKQSTLCLLQKIA